MRFCQFVELTHMPSKTTLWFLLGRRAAGVLPVNQAGEDLALPVLVLPICRDHDVSFIQVHVTNVLDTDGKFFESVRTTLDASMNGLMTPSHGPIRLFMSLRTSSTVEPAQGVVFANRVNADDLDPPTIALVVRGMCEPSKQPRAKMLIAIKRWPAWRRRSRSGPNCGRSCVWKCRASWSRSPASRGWTRRRRSTSISRVSEIRAARSLEGMFGERRSSSSK